MTSDQSDDGGPVAQEARRLAEAVSAWAASSQRSQTADEHEEAAEEQDPGRPGCSCGRSDAVDAVCSVCPVCRVAAAVQAIQPEVIERAADVLTMFAGSLQQVADERRRQRESEGDTGEASDERPTSDETREAGRDGQDGAP